MTLAAPPCSLPDLLAFLPYHLGFYPKDSLVVVGLEGSRVDLVERADLPGVGELDEAMTRRLVAGLARRPLDRAVIAAFTEAERPGAALDALVVAVAEVTSVARVVIVGEDRWRDRDGTVVDIRTEDGAVDEVGWNPLPDPSGVPLIVEYVGRGVAPLMDRRALESLLATCPDPCTENDLPAQPISARRGLAAWERLLLGGRDTADVATALGFLRRVADRDEVLTRLVPLGHRRDTAAVWPAVDSEASTLDRLGARARTRSTLIHLARSAPGSVRAPMMSILAVWAWHCGDGATAGIAAGLALDHDPHHRLATLVTRLLLHDVRPPSA